MTLQSNCEIPTPENVFDITYSDPGPLAAETAAMGLHCWGGSKADLDSQAAQLAAEGYRIITFNFPEVESRAIPLNMEERLLIIDGLARKLQLNRFGLICHSFGTEVGLEYATRYPQRVAGIFNCAGSMEQSDRNLTGLATEQSEDEFVAGGAVRFVEKLGNLSRDTGFRLYAERVASFLGNRQWLAAYHNTAAQSVEHAAAGGSLQQFFGYPGIKMYVHGEFERADYLPEIQARHDVETVEIPGAGHFPNIDNPNAYTVAVRAFMQKINS